MRLIAFTLEGSYNALYMAAAHLTKIGTKGHSCGLRLTKDRVSTGGGISFISSFIIKVCNKRIPQVRMVKQSRWIHMFSKLRHARSAMNLEEHPCKTSRPSMWCLYDVSFR